MGLSILANHSQPICQRSSPAKRCRNRCSRDPTCAILIEGGLCTFRAGCWSRAIKAVTCSSSPLFACMYRSNSSNGTWSINPNIFHNNLQQPFQLSKSKHLFLGCLQQLLESWAIYVATFKVFYHIQIFSVTTSSSHFSSGRANICSEDVCNNCKSAKQLMLLPSRSFTIFKFLKGC